MSHTLHYWIQSVLTLLVAAGLFVSPVPSIAAPLVPGAQAADLHITQARAPDERNDTARRGNNGQGWLQQTDELTSTTIIGEGVHIITEQQGTVRFTRGEGGNFVPVQVGTQLEDGDTLQGDATSRATIVCADLSLVEVDFTATEVRCDEEAPVLEENAPENERASIDGAQVLLSPRKTFLLNTTPTIRWQNVEGVTVEEISLEGPDVEWSANVAGETQIAYPSDAPPLQPGNGYSIALTVNQPDSVKVEPTDELTIIILSASNAQEVERDEGKIRDLGVPDLPTRLLVAQLYEKYRLYAEAIDLLEGVPTVEADPEAQQVLADLYLFVELDSLARERYDEVLSLAGTDNISLQAAANHRIGSILKATGENEEAQERLLEARALYQQYGDAEQVAEVEQLLDDLPPLGDRYYLPLIARGV